MARIGSRRITVLLTALWVVQWLLIGVLMREHGAWDTFAVEARDVSPIVKPILFGSGAAMAMSALPDVAGLMLWLAPICVSAGWLVMTVIRDVTWQPEQTWLDVFPARVPANDRPSPVRRTGGLPPAPWLGCFVA